MSDSNIHSSSIKKNNLFILTGKIHSGKTTFLQKMCNKLKEDGLKINGLLSPAYYEDENRRGYNGLNIKTNELFPLTRTEGKSTWEKEGPYYFIPEGLKKAEEAILDFKDSDLTIIDEIGPLEMKKRGLWKDRSQLLHNNRHSIIVIRNTILEDFLCEIEENPMIFDMGKKNLFKRMRRNLINTINFIR